MSPPTSFITGSARQWTESYLTGLMLVHTLCDGTIHPEPKLVVIQII